MSLALASTAWPALAHAQGTTAPTAWEASQAVDDNDMITTGVAKGRDRLDSATSTSVLKENEITKLSPRSLADLLRNVPGIRVEAAAGEGGNGYTVRGLPMVADGSKYLQIQEDGLPVMELGDLFEAQVDHFVRADFNVAQIESIRGGSASTFASNAPGGAINLVSKTGEVEGGSVQLSTGLDYDSKRIDADYGGQLGGGWRFHVGGFYRSGEGPRATGFTTFRGGQVKANITREFAGGHIRFYAKLLDDRSPLFAQYPVRVTGTNDKPQFSDVPGFPLVDNTLLSAFITTSPGQLNGVAKNQRFSDGIHATAKSAGAELVFTLSEWTITDRFRYADMSIVGTSLFPNSVGTPVNLAASLGVTNPSFTYASGPLTGRPFDPSRGSGLLALSLGDNTNTPDVGSITNDLRASRVWATDLGSLTTTLGVYKARQNYEQTMTLNFFVQDVQAGGKSSLVDIRNGTTGAPATQNGFLITLPNGSTGTPTRYTNVGYDITAPYGSFNLQHDRVAIGGSLRYDFDRVIGTVTPAGQPVNYRHGYLSYSTGINFRIADPLAIFARYSKGGRAAGDALLNSPGINPLTGDLVDRKSGNDSVRQAEAGLKFRQNGLTLNLTAFHAQTRETTSQVNQDAAGNSQVAFVQRGARAYGAEFEGGYRTGPFSVTASGTMVDAKITSAEDPALVGNTPRHQPALIYQLTPQYDVERFSVGANIVGVTRSYAQDVNQLRLPAYTTVGLFAEVRPVDRLVLSVNASNLFNARAITETLEPSLPASNIALARTLYGRMVSAAVRFFY